MRHRKSGRKFGRTASHRRAMFRNMVTSFFRYERIETTDAKAKELRGLAERLITKTREDTVHSRRMVAKWVTDREVLAKLFSEIGPRYKTRPGGYTRIVKIGERLGDNALMSLIELVPVDGGN